MLHLLIMLIKYCVFNFIIVFFLEEEDGKEYIYKEPKLNFMVKNLVQRMSK